MSNASSLKSEEERRRHGELTAGVESIILDRRVEVKEALRRVVMTGNLMEHELEGIADEIDAAADPDESSKHLRDLISAWRESLQKLRDAYR